MELRMPEVPVTPAFDDDRRVPHEAPASERMMEPADERDDDVTIDDVRARLAARGLLATSPRIVVPKEPRPETDSLGAYEGLEPGEGHWADSEFDEWDVEPGLEDVTVRCPQCRDVYFRPIQSTRFLCPACDRAWRWAICTGCDELAFTIERQESWRCGCGVTNRSWWRTPTAQKTAFAVVTRRKHLLIEQERKLVREGIKKRRWKLIALAAWSAVVAIGIVVGVRMAEPSEATGTATTCTQFGRLRSELASGTLSREQLDARLEELHRSSQGADESVQKGVVELRAATPGTSGFLIARTTLADACDALENR